MSLQLGISLLYYTKMFDFYYLLVFLISVCASFFSGLLAIGGGIIIFPFFLYLMPALGYTAPSISIITGISAAQSLAGVFFAWFNHKKLGTLNKKLIKKFLPVGIVGSFAGAIAAKFISGNLLLWAFEIILIVAAIMTILPERECSNIDGECHLNEPLITYILVFIGTTISSSLGFAGAVTFTPIFNHLCKAPIKVAISTTTLIILILMVITFLGKASVGLIPYNLIPYIIPGAFIGANLGTKVNKALPDYALKIIFFLVIIFLGIRIFLTAISGING